MKTTRDGQTIDAGTKIYYTGDMANSDGFFTVTEMRGDCYSHVVMVEDEQGPDACGEISDPRTITVPFSSFEAGPGRRFTTRDRRDAEREAVMRQYRQRYARRNER